MKKVLIFTLLCLATGIFQLYSQEEKKDVDYSCGEECKHVFHDVCRAYVLAASNSENTIEVFRQEILKVMGDDAVFADYSIYDEVFVNFLNFHFDKIVCLTSKETVYRKNAQIFKCAMELRDDSFIDYLIKGACSKDISVNINLNHYDMIDGNKETFLDFINIFLEDHALRVSHTPEKLNRIKKFILRCGAKKGSEL